jgi:transposase
MKLARKYARIAHVRRDALHKGTSLLTRAALSLEERAARKAEIAASLLEPKTKVKARKGKRSRPVDMPALPKKIAKRVKAKHVKRLLRLAQLSDVLLRPAEVVLEDLHVDGMKHNRKLALSISDVGLGEFRRQMGYKTAWQGEALLLADRWFPSTKMCSGCGNVKEDMDLSERIYVCENPACGLVIDRDLNAALNLAALARPSQQPGPYREFLGKGETPVERGALVDLSQDGSVKLPLAKQEPNTDDGLSIQG